MDSRLSDEEMQCLKTLDTHALEKPELPQGMADRLVEQGLAIRLVEGGLQLTALGREYLVKSNERKA
jgi:hypothetical protein